LKNKGFKEERMTKVGLYAIDKSTILESNKSLAAVLASIVCICHPPLARYQCVYARRACARSLRCPIAFLLLQGPASGRRALNCTVPLSAG
jgi:hypothetical protein